MANCCNCSAPLPANSIRCDYCGTRNDVDLAGIHYYTTHEPESERTCPRCGVALKTVDLKVQGKFLIERCDHCLGLFFDPGELEALLHATVSNVFTVDKARLETLSNSPRAMDYGVSYIKCPVCSTVMNRVNFGAKSGVVIDRCKEHGVWLDGGELRHLFEWTKAGGKLHDQERREQQQRQEALEKERKARQTPGSGGVNGGYGGYDDYDSGRVLRNDEVTLLDLLCRAAVFLLR